MTVSRNAELDNPVTDMQIREMVKDTFSLFDAFVKDKPSYVIGFTEAEFKANVLPYLVGIKTVPRESAPNFIGYLVSRAGSETSPIPVKAPNGEVLFNIPPVLNTNAIRSDDLDSKVTISTVSLEARLRGDRLPVEGRNLMNFALNGSDSPINVVKQDTVSKEMEEFFTLLEQRYGKEGTRPNKAVSVSTKSATDEDLLDLD